MTLTTIDKKRLVSALRARLEEELALAADSQKRTQLAATHEESRPENDKDTRAIESSYLARGQARRVVEIGTALTRLGALELRSFDAESRVALSAVVELSHEEGRSVCFLASAGGGLEVEVDGRTVQILTPESPIGRALVGQRCGDSFEVRTPRGLREYTIEALV